MARKPLIAPIIIPSQTTPGNGLPERLIESDDGGAEATRGFDATLANIRMGFTESSLNEEEAIELMTETLKTDRSEQRDNKVIRARECRKEFS